MITLLIECEDPERSFVSPQELAASLGLPLSRITGWRKNGGGPKFTKWGKSVVYRVSDVLEWSDANRYSMTGVHADRASRRSR